VEADKMAAMLHAGGGPTPSIGVGTQLRRSFVVVWAAVGVALAIGVVTLLVSLLILDPELDRTGDTSDASYRAAQAMLSENTALRGYLGGGQEQYLIADQQAQRDLVSADAAFEAGALRDPQLAPLFVNVRIAEAAWVGQWANPTSQIPVHSLPSGAALTRLLDEGGPLFDTYQIAAALVGPVITQELDSIRGDQTSILLAALLLEAGLFIAGFITTTFQQRKLRRSIVGPVDNIMNTMRLAASGDLSRRAEVGGPLELQQIATGLNAMSEALASERAARATREAEAAAQAERLTLILSVAREIAGSLSLRYVLRTVGLGARSMTGQDSAHVWLTDETRHTLIPAYDSSGPDGVPMDQAAVPFGEETAGKAAKYGRSTVEEVPEPDAATSRLAVPMIVGARVVGVLEVRGSAVAHLDEGRLEALEALATHAASAIEAARLHVELERRSEIDALTHLPNRHRFDDDLAAECARSLRYGRPLAFVMMDVDHFKNFNDTYGHQRGDEVLQEVATVLAHEVRDGDTAYRYGGEEFGVLLRESDSVQGEQAAERIRSRIEAAFADRGWAQGVTASFGVAEFSETVSTEKRLVEAADRALYEAKHAGRNRVVVTQDPRSAVARNAANDAPRLAIGT
jgi:diguanylate cyclase (GGDEF)-like protein